MIELKEGWTGRDAMAQYEMDTLNAEIKSLNKKLEAALLKRAEIQSKCEHAHTADGKCEVCGVEVK